MKKPEIGQVLYSLNIGDAARHRKQELKKVTVSFVGRKYFKVVVDGSGWERQYRIDDWHETYEYGSSNSRLFTSLQAWEDDKGKTVLLKEFRDIFGFGGGLPVHLSLNDCKKIKQILTEAESRE